MRLTHSSPNRTRTFCHTATSLAALLATTTLTVGDAATVFAQAADKTPAAGATAAANNPAAPAATAPAAAQKLPWDDETRLPGDIAQLLQDRKYDEAIAALDQLAVAAQAKNTEASKAVRDRALYAKGRAQHLAGKYDEAVATLEALEKESPKSEWGRRARFARGVALAKKGEFASAELIYRAEAEWLLSTERKQSLAGIYLEFARRYATPKDDRSPPDQPEPDYAKAIEFFQKAVEMGPKPELLPELALQIADCRRLSGDPGQAASLYEKFLKDYPDHGRIPEARFRLGESQLATGDRVRARQTWQDLLAAWPDDRRPSVAGSPPGGPTQADFLAEAAFRIAQTHGFPRPENDDALVLGVAALENYIKRFAEHKFADRARLWIVEGRIFRGRFGDAAAAAEQYLADPKFAACELSADARHLLGIALQRQKKFTEAIGAFRDFLTKHPTHSRWNDVQQRIIETEYFIGADAYARKDYDAARKQWNEFLVRYPLDPRSPSIWLAFGEMLFQAEKYEEAIAEWRRLVSKYPGQEAASQAQFRIASTFEDKLGKPTEAMVEYRKLNWGSRAGAAHSRLTNLTAKQMTIVTDRIYRTDEAPMIDLKTRNVDKVTVRVYRVDLETYFRKMHQARGVESLDLALIDPDKSFEFTVPNYAEFKPLESRIPIELEEGARGEGKAADAKPSLLKSAVLAVVVSSKTLEATTLVIRSDLDVIVKSSRDEVFVYAQNMLTGKPWKGARLLVSNGSEVIAEGVTADDGVFRNAPKQLAGTEQVRVFAVADGHTASNTISLGGIGVGKGLEERGYLYSDRAAYRPGQTVHVRGIVRGVSDDKFVIMPKKKYHLEVFDERNRVVHQAEMVTGDFGSFHTHFSLPAVAAPGTYRLHAADIDGRSFQGNFRVDNYQLEPVQLSIDLPKKVIFRGEELEGTITAKFYYGTPLVGREIRYTLGDGRMHTGTTDDGGNVKFKFPTREYRESQTLHLSAELPERNLAANADILLAVQAFSVDVSTIRSVMTSGESFEVTLTARTADGKPTAEKLQLHVIEKMQVDGRPGEREVAIHEVATDAKSGVGRVTLTLEKGAQYVLRASGTDRYKNPVTGEHEVTISDDADTVRLRILADRHTFKVGDEAKLRVHWREADAPALVTYQGAKILGYRLITLKKGDNTLAIPMEAHLAPNFHLEVNVLADQRGPKPKDRPARRFHAASTPVSVERELGITLEVRRRKPGDAKAEGPLAPGETVDLVVRTVDSQGNPVSAELSLALIDRAIWDRFGSSGGAIHDFFKGAVRAPAVRTTASIEFEYKPSTSAINPRLLSERERVEIAAQEEELRKSLAAVSERGAQGYAAAEPTTGADGPMGGPMAGSGQQFRFEAQPGAGPYGARTDTLGWIELHDGAYTGNKPGEAAGVEGLRGLMKDLEQERQAGNQPMPAAKPAAVPQSAPDARRRLALGQDEKAKKSEVAMLGMSAADVFSADLTIPFKESAPEQKALAELGRPMVTSSLEVDALRRLERSGGREMILLSDGVQANLNFAGAVEGERGEKLVEQLKRTGGVLLPALELQETGYWNPAVVTDAEGNAKLELTLPERSTAWKLSARGITVETLAGEAESDLTAKKELFAELTVPSVVTDGDKAQVGVVVHDEREKTAGDIQVVFQVKIGDKTVELKRSIEKGARIHELSFPLAAELAKAAEESQAALTLTVRAGEAADAADRDNTVRADTVRRTLAIRPYGLPMFATAGGTARSDVTAWVESPVGDDLERPQLEIVVGAGIDRTLLDAVFGSPIRFLCGEDYSSTLERSTSDLLASVALQKLLSGTREAGSPEASQLDARIRSTIGFLTSAQNEDGGWTWSGSAGSSDRRATARVVWALSAAKAAGYKITPEGLEKALQFVASQQAALGDDDLDGKAVLLHALSEAGRGDFAVANRLYRSRASLSTAGAAYLGLALVKMDHGPMAADLLATVVARPAEVDDAKRAATNVVPSRLAKVEETALLALALGRARADAPRRKENVDRLLAERRGNRWSPERATGPAVVALAEWSVENRPGGERYELVIVVNDYEAARLQIDPAEAARSVAIDAKHLKSGKQRIQFKMTGRGELVYQCTLGGFVAADKLKTTARTWYVRRYYEPAPREFDGRELPRGFGGLSGSYNTFRNPLTQLPVGRRGRVEIEAWRSYNGNPTDDQLEYLIVREPLPAGVSVVESSVKGPFERHEVLPGEIVFYVGNRRGIGTITFDVVGTVDGQYRAAPTTVIDAHRPDRMVVTAPAKLDVLARGQTSTDKYRWTPEELAELGRRHFARRDFKAVVEHLGELLASWPVGAQLQQEALGMLLDAHLVLGPPTEIVKYFELVKEKSPDAEITFEKILKVGTAYHELGEYERSYLVFRATVESSFGRDGQVVGFLDAQGEFLRSVEVMRRLLGEYPPEPYVAAAEYALAQQVYGYAPRVAGDEKLRALKLTRLSLIDAAGRMIDDFLTAHPDDPAADEAAFAAANAWLELERYDLTIARAQAYAARYPKSEFVDSYWYLVGYSHFAAGRSEEALEMCRKVAEMKRRDEATGRETASRNRERAIYILGQIYHSLGKAADAIREYTRVATQIPDAKKAIDYFAHRAIDLPEVTTIRPGEPAKVTLKFRNVPTVDVKAYRIDLMKFSLLRQNLSAITSINLAGIRPLHETAVTLGDGKDYRDREHELTLPIQDEGAYLVVCRGDNLHASGFVLVSPLKIEVQEEASSGQVRATVKNVKDDKFAAGVHVKIIGSRDGEFKAGETDLRGVFATEPVAGNTTVIAQADSDRYAFYRGKVDLLPGPVAATSPAAPPAPQVQQDAGAKQQSGKDYLLQELRIDNRRNQELRQNDLQNKFYRNDNKGVKARDAF
jgi:uncharacterized protein YfaS (alpha-2-macroglobulin family)/TolA-binding protein